MNLFSVFNFIGKDDIQSFLSVSVIAYNLQPSITRIISAKKQASVSKRGGITKRDYFGYKAYLGNSHPYLDNFLFNSNEFLAQENKNRANIMSAEKCF